MISPHVRRLLWVRGLRAFGDGFVSLLLPLSLIASGALAAGLPGLMIDAALLPMRSALQLMFVLYGAIGVVAAMIYRKLPADFAADTQATTAPLKKSRRVVYVLAALFSLDAFGGGFIVQSMLALWTFEKFQWSRCIVAGLFFWTGARPA